MIGTLTLSVTVETCTNTIVDTETDSAVLLVVGRGLSLAEVDELAARAVGVAVAGSGWPLRSTVTVTSAVLDRVSVEVGVVGCGVSLVDLDDRSVVLAARAVDDTVAVAGSGWPLWSTVTVNSSVL